MKISKARQRKVTTAFAVSAKDRSGKRATGVFVSLLNGTIICKRFRSGTIVSKILLVEDDNAFSAELSSYLRAKGYAVEIVTNCEKASDFLRVYAYDLVILDWELPDKPGVEFLADYRRGGGRTPVLMLTGRSAEQNVADGLELGADDYVTKPFSHAILGARIKALLRRPTDYTGDILQAGDLRVDPEKLIVMVGDSRLAIHRKEVEILCYLLRKRGQLVSADTILGAVWSSNDEATDYTVRQHIYSLRKKLSLAGLTDIIQTVHGSGYRINS